MKKELENLKKNAEVITANSKDGKIQSLDAYLQIEKIVRQRIKISDDASDYLRRRFENNIYYGIKGGSEQ